MENTEVRNIISETLKCYASVTLGRHAPPGIPGACRPDAGRHAPGPPVGITGSGAIAWINVHTSCLFS